MANNKIGLNYYNVDTDRYQDIKIKRLKKDFGCSGIAVFDYLLCEIYRVKGCFIAWDESTAFDVAEYFGIKESLVNEIVNYCGVVGLFNRELLMRGSILTSLPIQKRYLDFCIKAKRANCEIPKNVKIQEESNIIPEGCDIIPEESHIIPEGCDEVKRSKVKGSKEKENADFLSKIIEAFQNSYFDIFQIEYVVMSKGKERAAASKILETYKGKYPQSTSLETLNGLQAYFQSCCQIQDPWLQKNISLPIIVSKFNEINNSIRNGKPKNRTVSSRSEELDAAISSVYSSKGL